MLAAQNDLKIALVGYGYWGNNLLRNFFTTPGIRCTRLADLSENQLAKAKGQYLSLSVSHDWQETIASPDVEAVAIATPIGQHFPVAKAALEAGKHVLLAKPMAASSAQAQELAALAEKHQRVLMLDHTYVYTPAVQRIREYIDSGELGAIRYYDSMRVNLGLFQPDASVIWDLAIHDLAIIDYLFEEKPTALSCTSAGHIAGSHENIGFLTLFFPSGMIAHVNVNWLSPVKIRRVLIGGTERMLTFDDMEPSEKIRLYDSGVTVFQKPDAVMQTFNYRMGDVLIPALNNAEALRTELLHFLDCIKNGTAPMTPASSGVRLTRLLEAAEDSARRHGAQVELA
jgi:predicted dehydrogenase